MRVSPLSENFSRHLVEGEVLQLQLPQVLSLDFEIFNLAAAADCENLAQPLGCGRNEVRIVLKRC